MIIIVQTLLEQNKIKRLTNHSQREDNGYKQRHVTVAMALLTLINLTSLSSARGYSKEIQMSSSWWQPKSLLFTSSKKTKCLQSICMSLTSLQKLSSICL